MNGDTLVSSHKTFAAANDAAGRLNLRYRNRTYYVDHAGDAWGVFIRKALHR